MKAITVQPPWASPIVMGVKDVENRSWKTGFRGRVLIHQGRRVDERAMQSDHWLAKCGASYGRALDLPRFRGYLIGSVELYDIQLADDCELDWANTYRGYAWLLRAPRVFTRRLPLRGMPGLFEVADTWLAEQGIGEALHPTDMIRRLQQPEHVPEDMAD